MLPAVFSIEAWVLFMPLDLAGALVGLVVRIGRKLILLPFPLAGALTVLVTAVQLVLYASVDIIETPAMRTCNLDAHGFPPGEENHKPVYHAQWEVNRRRKETTGREEKGFCMRKRKKTRNISRSKNDQKPLGPASRSQR